MHGPLVILLAGVMPDMCPAWHSCLGCVIAGMCHSTDYTTLIIMVSSDVADGLGHSLLRTAGLHSKMLGNSISQSALFVFCGVYA